MTPVFVHGAGASADFWEFQRPLFPGALFPNLPGHSSRRLSAPDNAPVPSLSRPLRSIEAYADWLIGLIEEQGLRDVVLAGHSMGGAIALDIALRRPAWLSGLVLSSTGASLPISSELLQLVAGDHQAAVNWIVEHSFAPGANRYRVEGVRRQLLRTPGLILEADYRACSQFNVTARLEADETLVPTAVICGISDRLIPTNHSRFLADHIAGSTFTLIEGAGHLAPLEKPAAWAEAALAKFSWKAKEEGATEVPSRPPLF